MMETIIASVGTYLTSENIAWALGMALGLEQVLGFTKVIKSNSSLELVWNVLKFINKNLKKKDGRTLLPILLMAVTLGCATLPPVEDIRDKLDMAEVTLVLVEELAAELDLEGIVSTKDIEKLKDGTTKAKALIESARLLLDEGNRKDAVTTLIKLNRLIIDLENSR
jgi:hypothetical protein